MLYFWKAQGPRTSKLIFPTVKYTNTNSQIHKYSFWQSARNTQHMLYFWTAGASRMSKMIFSSVPSVTRFDPRSDPIQDLKVRLQQIWVFTNIKTQLYRWAVLAKWIHPWKLMNDVLVVILGLIFCTVATVLQCTMNYKLSCSSAP